jgi:hypothetical protein
MGFNSTFKVLKCNNKITLYKHTVKHNIVVFDCVLVQLFFIIALQGMLMFPAKLRQQITGVVRCPNVHFNVSNMEHEM